MAPIWCRPQWVNLIGPWSHINQSTGIFVVQVLACHLFRTNPSPELKNDLLTFLAVLPWQREIIWERIISCNQRVYVFGSTNECRFVHLNVVWGKIVCLCRERAVFHILSSIKVLLLILKCWFAATKMNAFYSLYVFVRACVCIQWVCNIYEYTNE